MERLDALLVKKGLCTSRERAKELIQNGQVTVDGRPAKKVSEQVPEDAELSVTGETLKYVSRGGLKLEKAVSFFSLDVKGAVCMDIGASTGGFTDVLLQNGAAKVYAVDVGRDQLHEKLKKDSRVISMEQTNIRYLNSEDIDGTVFDFICCDASFISLTLILPVIKDFLKEGGKSVCLIKPQFEAGKQRLGKNGVVKNPKVHEDIKKEITAFSETIGLKVRGITESPVKGPEGNTEFLMLVEKV